MGWLINPFRFSTLSNLYSMLFDGVNEYLTVPDNASLDFEYNTPFSISSWVYRTSSTNIFIISKQDNNVTTYRGYDITFTSLGYIQLEIFSDYGGGGSGQWLAVRTNTSAMTTGQWYHIVAVYNGDSLANNCKIYINGISTSVTVIQDTLGSNTILNNNELNISRRANGTNYYNGYQDEISIWNKALTAGEVTELYNSGKPKNLNTHSAVANLVSWWRMGDGNASWNGSAWTVPDEIKYKYLAFDGVNEYLTASHNTNLNIVYNQASSVSLWINASNLGTIQFLIGKSKAVADYQGWSIRVLDTKYIYAQLSSGANIQDVRGSTVLSNSQWYHIVFTKSTANNATGLKFYINGVAETMTIITNQTNDATMETTEPLRIGARDDFYFNGYIDEVSVWNKELTGSEVTELYNKGRKVIDYTQLSFSANCVMYNKMDSLNPIDQTGVNNATSVNQEIADVIEATGNDATSVNMEEADRTTVVP